jgi:NADPH:quinone reductase-like Zn-dependent oxidoreductase
MPENTGACMAKVLAPTLNVQSVPYPESLSEGQVLVRNAAVAINPIDWIIQERGDLAYPHLKPPIVLGHDVAGEIVAVGKGVTRFHIGDRVCGLASGTMKEVNDRAQGGFQRYTVLHQDWTSHVANPNISLELASVMPLGIFTAAAALFDPTCLGMQLPTEPRQAPRGETVIVWGASSSVGCCAVQLAVAAGYQVVATASPRNHALVRQLGATSVWDYRSGSVVEDIVAALKGTSVAGAVSIGDGAAEKCMDILQKTTAGKKHVALVTFPLPEKKSPPFVALRTVVDMVSWMAAYKAKGLLGGVGSGLVLIRALEKSGIGRYVAAEYLPKALEAGTFVPAPEAEVVGHGLEAIQDALARQKKGVSARKIVVTL